MSSELISTAVLIGRHRQVTAGCTARACSRRQGPAGSRRWQRCYRFTPTGTTRTDPFRRTVRSASRSVVAPQCPPCPPTSPCCAGSTSARTSAWRCRRCARSSRGSATPTSPPTSRAGTSCSPRARPSRPWPTTWRRRSRTSWASTAASSTLSRAELARAVADNPYPDEPDPKRVHAIFLTGTAGQAAQTRLAQVRDKLGEKVGRDEAADRRPDALPAHPRRLRPQRARQGAQPPRRPGRGDRPQLGDGDEAAGDVRGLICAPRGPSPCNRHNQMVDDHRV